MIALGLSGLANIPIEALIATVIPIIAGMVLGNIDKKVRDFFEPAGSVMIPFVGFALGAGIDLMNVIKGGLPGIALGLITIFIGGAFIILCDRLISKRPGYAAVAVSTTAGNAVAVPAAVALVDPSWAPYVGTATTQVAAAVVVSAILVPILTDRWAKRFGCPKMPLG